MGESSVLRDTYSAAGGVAIQGPSNPVTPSTAGHMQWIATAPGPFDEVRLAATC
jgi:hypothetical protein